MTDVDRARKWFNPRHPFSQTLPLRKERIRVVQPLDWVCPLELDELRKRVRTILTHFCNTAVVGYDRTRCVFWCKKYVRNVCQFHLELSLTSDINGQTRVHVVPVFCYNDDLEKFACDFRESIQLYLQSNFIRSILSLH